jgi:hypothetical protein
VNQNLENEPSSNIVKNMKIKLKAYNSENVVPSNRLSIEQLSPTKYVSFTTKLEEKQFLYGVDNFFNEKILNVYKRYTNKTKNKSRLYFAKK